MIAHTIPLKKCLCTLSLALTLVNGIKTEADDFKLAHQQDGQLDIIENDRLVGRYMFAHDISTPETLHATYKPFLHIIDPASGTPITKGPGGQFTHHRGIFLGWNRLTTDRGRFDFWHMNGCFQVHQQFTSQLINEHQAAFTSQIDWIDKDSKTVIHEWREMSFSRSDMPDSIAIVDISTKLIPTEDLKLNGDPEHSGVQYRPANDVQKNLTQYLFPQEGQDPRKDLDLPWVGECYQTGSGKYAVIHMNHPDNPKQTKYSAYRDYGRFGAFFTQTLKKEEPLNIHYRLIILKGTLPERSTIQKHFDRWTAQP